MKRTITEIVKENNECQLLFDRITMEIGQLFAKYNRTKDEKIHLFLNSKIEVLKIVESRLIELERELSETNLS